MDRERRPDCSIQDRRRFRCRRWHLPGVLDAEAAGSVRDRTSNDYAIRGRAVEARSIGPERRDHPEWTTGGL